MTSLSKSFQLSPLTKLVSGQHYLLLLSYLAGRWLSEPQSPLMHQWVLDIEVVLVVEDSGLLIITLALGLIASIWGNRDGLEIYLLTFCGCHICDCERNW